MRPVPWISISFKVLSVSLIKLLSLNSTLSLWYAGLELYKLHFFPSLVGFLLVFAMSSRYLKRLEGRKKKEEEGTFSLFACYSYQHCAGSCYQSTAFLSAMCKHEQFNCTPTSEVLAPALWSPFSELWGSDNLNLFYLFTLPQCLFTF